MSVLLSIVLFFALCIGLWGLKGLLYFVGICAAYLALLWLASRVLTDKNDKPFK